MFAVYSMYSDIIYNISDLEATLEALKVSLERKMKNERREIFIEQISARLWVY